IRRAESLYQQALELLKKAGDRRGQAYTEQNFGSLLAREGSHSATVGHFRESLAVKQTIHDQFGEAESLHYLGVNQHALGDSGARTTLEQALELRTSGHDRLGRALTLGALARLDFDAGEFT